MGEPSGTNQGFWTDTQWNTVIERAQQDFAIKTKCLKTYAEFVTVADTLEYDMGESSLANLIDIAEVWYFLTDSKKSYDPLVGVTRDRLSHYQGEFRDVTGIPSYYCYEDRVIEFDVKQSADKYIRIYYYKSPTAYTADDDSGDIPVKFHSALVAFVCWKMAVADVSNADRLMLFKTEYFDEVMQARSVLRPASSTYPRIKDDTEMPY